MNSRWPWRVLGLATLGTTLYLLFLTADNSVVYANPDTPAELSLAPSAGPQLWRIAVRIVGSGNLVVPEGNIPLTSWSPDCQGPDDRRICHILFQRQPGPAQALRIVLPADGEVAAFSARLITETPATALSYGPSWLVLAGLLCVMLALRRLPGPGASHDWMIAGAGAAALALFQPVVTAAALLLLIVAFTIGKRFPHAGEARRAALLLALSSVFLIFAISRLVETVGEAELGILPRGVRAIGISYICIRVADTLLKQYRGQLSDATLREYLAYVLFPPTLLAGPIETLDHFRGAQLRRLSRDDIAEGCLRIAIGLFKKLLLADALFAGVVAYNLPLVAADPDKAAPSLVVNLLVCSLLFNYFDFAGYSDMAIGVARLFGYQIFENFNWPLLAGNLREFWGRWHMSLSRIAFRNLFFPVAVRTRSEFIGFFATMLFIGVWHAASLNWLIWSLHHASGLAVIAGAERWFGRARGLWTRWGAPLRVLATLGYVALAQSFIIFTDAETGIRCYLRPFGALVHYIFG
jgi:alginate O-acetyltransferase complex protein AlgI